MEMKSIWNLIKMGSYNY